MAMPPSLADTFRGAASAASCCGGVSTERASGVSRTCAIGESVEG